MKMTMLKRTDLKKDSFERELSEKMTTPKKEIGETTILNLENLEKDTIGNDSSEKRQF